MTAAIYAAGAVCWRVIDDKVKVLVIHRPRHDDVTFPKGKVDPGESLPQTAVREIKEETGLDVALGTPIGVSRYTMPSGLDKIVHYWAAEVTDDAVLVSSFLPNDEVAALEWVSIKKARTSLSYEHDTEILDNFSALVDQKILSTFAIIVLRHAKAVPGSQWDGPDASRPLTRRGEAQADDVASTLAAWGPHRIISSTATRCAATVRPLATALEIAVNATDDISQDAYEQGTARVRDVVGKRVRKRKTAVLCSHGPVIPEIIREVALATGTPTGSYVQDSADLSTSAFSVIHLSLDRPSSGIIAIETHEPRV